MLSTRSVLRFLPLVFGVCGLLGHPFAAQADSSTLATQPTTGSSIAAVDDSDDAELAAATEKMVNSLSKTTASDIGSLATLFLDQQAGWLTITPPISGFTLEQDGGMVVFDPSAFPEDFNKGLVGDLENECPVYTLTVMEDPVQNKVIFFNALGQQIYAVTPAAGYDPYWQLHKAYPDLYSGTYSQARIAELMRDYSPSRVHVILKLLPADYLDSYAQALAVDKVAAAQAASMNTSLSIGGMSPMMMYQGPAVTNLFLSAIETMTNGIKVTLAYPNGFTNRVDFFTCNDLIGNWWDLAATTNVNTSQDWIEWLDTNALSQGVRFYAAGNADLDSDGDGISDAREKYMYHTCPTNSDSDGDGLSDYYEIFVLNTDPNNSKTNKPLVWISYPTNESRKVWLP